MRAGSLGRCEPCEVSVHGKRSQAEPQGTLFAVEKGVVPITAGVTAGL